MAETTTRAAAPVIVPFAGEHLDGAATLLAERHRAQRLVAPGLDAAYDDASAARVEIEGLWRRDGASGAAAIAEGGVDGEVIGAAIACPVEVSSAHTSLVRPPGAGFLGFAAVFPEHRGGGAGLLLGEAVLGWARSTGREWVVTDWRMTNLLSSRTWPRLGFRPTFYRLFRSIP